MWLSHLLEGQDQIHSHRPKGLQAPPSPAQPAAPCLPITPHVAATRTLSDSVIGNYLLSNYYAVPGMWSLLNEKRKTAAPAELASRRRKGREHTHITTVGRWAFHRKRGGGEGRAILSRVCHSDSWGRKPVGRDLINEQLGQDRRRQHSGGQEAGDEATEAGGMGSEPGWTEVGFCLVVKGDCGSLGSKWRVGSNYHFIKTVVAVWSPFTTTPGPCTEGRERPLPGEETQGGPFPAPPPPHACPPSISQEGSVGSGRNRKRGPGDDLS